MDLQNIKGPQDYQEYYYTSTEGLVWLDEKGNLIPLLHKLGMHVEAMDPLDLWNSIETWSKVHTVPAHKSGLSNSTAIEPKHTPLDSLLNKIQNNEM